MAKLIFVVALCIASTLAVPSGTPDSKVGDCFNGLKVEVRDAFTKSIDDLKGCATDAIIQIEGLRADLEAAILKAFHTLQEKIEEHNACNNILCKIKVIGEIADFVNNHIQEIEAITNKHLEILIQQFPEATECAENILGNLKSSAKDIILNFVGCIL